MAKTRHDENFPVGSLLLAPRIRPHVLAFYRFARAADDIADDPARGSEQKLDALARLQASLVDGSSPEAAPLTGSIAATGIGGDEARTLLVAFRADAEGQRCATFNDLRSYCDHSAAPVGRFLLRLHGETAPAAFAASDALCAALQILNHLQDAGDDWRQLGRQYIPTDWLPEGFYRPGAAALRRPVLDRCLDRVEAMLQHAVTLPALLHSRRLRAETRVILRLAIRLASRLREADPIDSRVRLNRLDFARAALGALRTPQLDDAALVAAQVRRARSSFGAGMRSLPRERRRAMFAVYAFCRAVDDIADGLEDPAAKRLQLDEWARDLDLLYRGQATRPLTRELAAAVRRFSLPRTEFSLILDAMRTDCAPRVRIADAAALDAYCRRAAGAPGVLSVAVFGADAAGEYAVRLGRALQLTNILRDLDSDARIDRLYVPGDLLQRYGIADDDAVAATRHPRFPELCATLAGEAVRAFGEAPVPPGQAALLRPALLMAQAYRQLLARLCARGWSDRRPVGGSSLGDKASMMLNLARAR